MAKIKWTLEKDEKLIKYLRAQKTIKQIEAYLNFSENSIYMRIKRFKDLGIVEDLQTGRKVRSKWDNTRLRGLLNLINSGLSETQAATKMGYASSGTINKVLRESKESGRVAVRKNKLVITRGFKKDAEGYRYVVKSKFSKDLLGPKNTYKNSDKKAFERQQKGFSARQWALEEEERLVKLYNLGMGYSAIAKEFNSTSAQVGKKIQGLRLKGYELPYREKKIKKTSIETKMLKNFINNYGEEGLDHFTNLIQLGISGEAIGKEFKVTRQRVNQWKKAFINTTSSLKDAENKEDIISSENLVPINPMDPITLMSQLTENQKRKVSNFIFQLLLEEPFEYVAKEETEKQLTEPTKLIGNVVERTINKSEIRNHSIF